jgi:hypothetical protein
LGINNLNTLNAEQTKNNPDINYLLPSRCTENNRQTKQKEKLRIFPQINLQNLFDLSGGKDEKKIVDNVIAKAYCKEYHSKPQITNGKSNFFSLIKFCVA